MNQNSEDLNDIIDEDEENSIPIGKAEFWQIIVHVHGKEINISVGDATQRIKWLAHVGIARWSEDSGQGWKKLGIPTSVRSKSPDGEELDFSANIRDVLENGDHIFISTSLAPNDTV
eukprot:gene13199-17687_t